MWSQVVSFGLACFSSFNKLLLQKEELEQKHLHLLQIVESEKTAKWQYTQQCEELASEIKKLRAEVRSDSAVPLYLKKKNYHFETRFFLPCNFCMCGGISEKKSVLPYLDTLSLAFAASCKINFIFITKIKCKWNAFFCGCVIITAVKNNITLSLNVAPRILFQKLQHFGNTSWILFRAELVNPIGYMYVHFYVLSILNFAGVNSWGFGMQYCFILYLQ